MNHYGTNNVNSEDAPEQIVNDIIQLGKVVKTEKKRCFYFWDLSTQRFF